MRSVRFSRATLVKVIVFMIISAVFTIGLALRIGNLRLFSHHYTLNAVFADAQGVFKGDAVKLAGVDVGRVAGTKIDHGRAIVTFTLDKDVQLHRDTIVAIRWRDVLGLRFLYLYPGRSGPVYRDGQTVPESQTEDAADLGEFLNQLGPILKAIDPQKANAFLDAMNTALAGNDVAVRGLIDSGATLATRLSAQDRQIQSLIDSSNTVTSTYAAQSDAIARILDDLNSLGGRLDSMTGDLDSFITNFADVQTQLNSFLQGSRSNIDATISEASSVLGTLARNKTQLAQTLCTLPAGLAPYFQTTSWGEWFNVRVVQIQLKDQNDRTITEQPEASGTRPPRAFPPPYTCPGSGAWSGGTPSGRGTGATGSTGSGSTGSSNGTHGGSGPAGGASQGFQDIGSFLKFILGGGSANG